MLPDFWRTLKLVQCLARAALLTVLVEATGLAQGTVVAMFEVPKDPPVLVGGPVFFNVILQNSSSDGVRVSLGHHGKWNYDFTLVAPDGTATPIPPYRQYGPGPRGTVQLEPHQTVVKTVLFNEWHTFHNPGEYVLKLKLAVLLSSSGGVSWQKEFSDNLTIKVAPRDPDKLREICATFVAPAVSANESDGAAAAEASLALSYVVDPVAVPFLARVLKEGSPTARENAIHGLARVGNPEALEILRSSLASADPALKSKIESALSQSRSGT